LTGIARKAGLSRATVPLVLNAVAHARIVAATRQKVRAIAAEPGCTRRAALQRARLRPNGDGAEHAGIPPVADPVIRA
jgi:DNA-binding LacI/PurR family transcriptional regulator